MSSRILTLLILFSIGGCGNFFSPKGSVATSNDSSKAGGPQFSEVRSQIFAPHCIECHTQYSDYSFVKKDLLSIQSSVLQNRMPKSSAPLSGDLKQLLADWINAGAPNDSTANNQTDADSDDSVLKPTWNSLYKNIFASRCTACHSPKGEAPWVNLSTRAGMATTLLKHLDFKNPAASNLIIRLSDKEEPMPPLPPYSNFQQLTEQEIEVVKAWIEGGLP